MTLKKPTQPLPSRFVFEKRGFSASVIDNLLDNRTQLMSCSTVANPTHMDHPVGNSLLFVSTEDGLRTDMVSCVLPTDTIMECCFGYFIRFGSLAKRHCTRFYYFDCTTNHFWVVLSTFCL
ncbi:hypothetical protein DPMN_015999 [Dreissena polymorpha]|uniref:Uncharacterized protein n=1 Tax=Dreissena polymorpha TaxID=45954 RepID=A0A9D4NDX3_DREPO|nr:hypothetical protein DPMN_015999 [Dreissena polymorpha]